VIYKHGNHLLTPVCKLERERYIQLNYPHPEAVVLSFSNGKDWSKYSTLAEGSARQSKNINNIIIINVLIITFITPQGRTDNITNTTDI